MLIELLLVSGMAAGAVRPKPGLRALAKGQRPRTPSGPLERARELTREARAALLQEGTEQLQLDLDPAQQARLTEMRAENRRQMRGSLGAFGLVLLGGLSPIFYTAAILAVLYLARDLFKLIGKDLREGHFFSVYLVGAVGLVGMILVGKLFLAALAGVLGGFFAQVVQRVEEGSSQELLRTFGGHPERVWVLHDDGVEVDVDFHQLACGDRVVVHAGEVIPVDGIVIDGTGQVDQHLLTGESQPAEKECGEQVFAATLLLAGRLVVQVQQTGTATVAAQIGQVLDQTQAYKDTLMNRGRVVANRFLPLTVGVSALTLPLLGAKPALAILWSDLGGSMAPAGPVTVLSYLQILSRANMLVKDGRVFESLGQVDTLVFDKTGTLTLEQPTVGRVHTLGPMLAEEVLRLAATAEWRQPHPVARAILARAEADGVQPEPIEAGQYSVGHGISVELHGATLRVGSARFMRQCGVTTEQPEALAAIEREAEMRGHTLIYVGLDAMLLGVLEVEPTLRPEAREVIAAMKQRGMQLYIISGDHIGPTARLAEALGIDHYFAEVLPEHKAEKVQQLRDAGRFVAFIGDGINDAIALKAAQVSISLKGASTAATDTAQVILMDGTLARLPELFATADEFEATMQRNLWISLVPGGVIITGVYLAHLGIAGAMGLFYLGAVTSVGNVLWPLLRHSAPDQIRSSGEAATEPTADLSGGEKS